MLIVDQKHRDDIMKKKFEKLLNKMNLLQPYYKELQKCDAVKDIESTWNSKDLRL